MITVLQLIIYTMERGLVYILPIFLYGTKHGLEHKTKLAGMMENVKLFFLLCVYYIQQKMAGLNGKL